MKWPTEKSQPTTPLSSIHQFSERSKKHSTTNHIYTAQQRWLVLLLLPPILSFFFFLFFQLIQVLFAKGTAYLFATDLFQLKYSRIRLSVPIFVCVFAVSCRSLMFRLVFLHVTKNRLLLLWRGDELMFHFGNNNNTDYFQYKYSIWHFYCVQIWMVFDYECIIEEMTYRLF